MALERRQPPETPPTDSSIDWKKIGLIALAVWGGMSLLKPAANVPNPQSNSPPRVSAPAPGVSAPPQANNFGPYCARLGVFHMDARYLVHDAPLPNGQCRRTFRERTTAAPGYWCTPDGAPVRGGFVYANPVFHWCGNRQSAN